MSFSNKVAAITGAGSGIGRALATRLAQSGCDLALSDIDATGLKQTITLVENSDIRISSCVLDVSDKEAMYAWAEQVISDHGQVNMIFNNAGVALSGTVASLPVEDYEWIMGINFWGVIYGTKAFLPYLEASGDGHVINISSVFGITSQPLMSGYNASKFAVRGFTESLRQDLDLTDSCVSSTCVLPGGIKTNVARSARMSGSVSDVTGLAQDAATTEFEKTFITTPDKAAKVILRGVEKNRRRVLIGPDSRLYDLCVRLAPASYQRLITTVVAWRSKRGQ